MRDDEALRIRDADAADVDTVLEFWRGSGADPSATDDGDSVLAAIGHSTSAPLMAYRATTLVGTTMVAWDGWRGTLYRVVVDPAAQRSGVASELVGEAERRLRAEGCRRISILVLRDEAPARRFRMPARILPGGVPERTNGTASKAVRGLIHPSRVRITPPPRSPALACRRAMACAGLRAGR